MKNAPERRPVDDLTPTTDIKLTTAKANLGMGMGNRFPKEYSRLPQRANHSIAKEGTKKGGA